VEDDKKTESELTSELKKLKQQFSDPDTTHSALNQSSLNQLSGEAFYRSLIENSLDILTILDAGGLFLYQSPNVQQILGYRPEDLIGKSAFEYIHPEDISSVMDVFNSIVANPGVSKSVDYRFRSNDGLWRYFESVGKMLPVEVGVSGVVVNSRDVTGRKGTEQALLESERRLHKAEEVSHIGNWEFLVDENIVHASNGAKIIYGFEGSEWQISNVREIPLPQYRPMLDEALTALIEHGSPYNVEFKIRRPSDGKIIDIQSLAEYDAENKTVFGVIQDISERKRAEEACRLSEQRLKLATASGQMGVWDWDITANILLWDDRMYELYGITRDSFTSVFEAWQDSLHPNDHVRVAEEVEAAIHGEKDFDSEFRIVQPDGTVRFIKADGTVFRDSDGNPLRMIGLNRDITRRKLAEEALKESESRFRALVEQATDAFFVHDFNGRFLDVNRLACETLGYSREELLRMSVLDVEMDFDLDSAQVAWAKMQPGQPFTLFGHHRRKDGTIFPIAARIGCFEWNGQRLILGLVRDITDRKRAEEEMVKLEQQLRQAQKMEAVGQLAGGIAHDFNNILSAIVGYAYLLQARMGSNDPSRDEVDQILESAQRAAEVTHSLLAFSKKQLMNPKPILINDVVKRSEKLLSRFIGEDITINTAFSDNEVECMADAAQIEQVLMNLATNARDAMSHGGRLTFSTECVEIDESFIRDHGYGRLGMFALISVSDTGEGMSKETAARIFEPFFTTKETGKGTGLGLAMVYGIVKQHDGYIDVYSEQGIGTTFNIYLPALELKEEVTKETIESLPSCGTETILVAEDNEKLRKLSEIILKRHGYRVILAQDGQESIEKFIENKDGIALVLLDMIMPKKSGKEVYDEIKRIKPDTKVIFVSGYTADRIDKESLVGENVDFLFKPVLPKDLLIKVRNMLEK
jgi:two-component system, cell cycle sensor histidine kinase and response regulator CckA